MLPNVSFTRVSIHRHTRTELYSALVMDAYVWSKGTFRRESEMMMGTFTVLFVLVGLVTKKET